MENNNIEIAETIAMYIKHPDMTETTAQIIRCDKDQKGEYIILDRSIFYPQGGGQPADQGRIFINDKEEYKVFDVRKIENETRHYIVNIKNDLETKFNTSFLKQNIKIIIDKDRRDINSKYHTAGHLIAAVAEKISKQISSEVNISQIKAVKGHQFPGEAY